MSVNQGQILCLAKDFFRDHVAAKHLQNTIKLKDIEEFNINPFTHKYLAQFAFGDSSPQSLAKAILYPRIMGTSISTTFGNQLQHFCSKVLPSMASLVPGIDIEFQDTVTGRKVYCQLKSGPTTINDGDVTTIRNHFKSMTNLARANQIANFNPLTDCVVGVFYGDEASLSQAYKNLRKDYRVLVGRDFWEHLTGDKYFYDALIEAFAEVASEMDATDIVDELVEELAQQLV